MCSCRNGPFILILPFLVIVPAVSWHILSQLNFLENSLGLGWYILGIEMPEGKFLAML